MAEKSRDARSRGITTWSSLYLGDGGAEAARRFVADFRRFVQHRTEAGAARFVEALDDVSHDCYRGIRLVREVGRTMG